MAEEPIENRKMKFKATSLFGLITERKDYSNLKTLLEDIKTQLTNSYGVRTTQDNRGKR